MFLAILFIYVANVGVIFDTSKYFASYFFLLFVNGGRSTRDLYTKTL